MPSDPTKPLLRLQPQADRPRAIGQPRPVPQPDAFSGARQTARIGPKFQRLSDILARGGSALELRADATALAPERLLVFEVRGAIGPFANAVRSIAGLELIDEEEMQGDDDDKAPVAYLMVPDLAALRNIESLWRRWQAGRLERGETPWANVFERLRDLRPWGPADRVNDHEAGVLALEVEGRPDNDPVRLEIELVFRSNQPAADENAANVIAAIAARGGKLISSARIPDIAYHSLLADLPVWAVQQIIQRAEEGIAGLESVMYIRPQAVATSLDVDDPQDGDAPEAAPALLGAPILALFDGVPVANHRLLANHIRIDDPFDLVPGALVANRTHGTAMASLIVHGDRNRHEMPLPRQIHVLPVMGNCDAFPDDRLVIDLIYLAVLRLRETMPDVLIVNLSLGNAHRPFHGQLSAWARLIDRLSHRFGLLFIVSAGNQTAPFGVSAFPTSIAFEGANALERAAATKVAINNIAGNRRLLSPAETLNGVTVGACNEDAVTAEERGLARMLIDPYPEYRTSNPSSALGPGFANAVKPDILMPGAREHLQVVRTHDHIDVRPNRPTRHAGLRVAAPPANGRENIDGYTSGTSAAAALASRTCHRIHDALEAEYGDEFLGLPPISRAVILKALLVHPAEWPVDIASLIKQTIGPAGQGQASRQKDSIRRFLGFGYVEADDAVACAADRATFFATGQLLRDRTVTVEVPVPLAMGGRARPHSLSATLAWFSPVSPGRKSYRSCRLKILEPEAQGFAIRAHASQPDGNQTNRGTIFTRSWSGDRAPAVTPQMTIPLHVQRDPDQAAVIDEPVVFGLAVTMTMPGVVEIYDQVRAIVRPQLRAAAGPA
ncbi:MULTISPECIES: S8 family peptidase [unclassified Sphingopyxis]|uniref:S8 family peptidase n=1 Tax=unclassified Sphingopyxis TaxID=2614943 RepID=UPI001E42F4D2|nr:MULTISPECIES: S8 family peptidase [unclassified Sphingopyxis]